MGRVAGSPGVARSGRGSPAAGANGRLTGNLPDWDSTAARLRAEHRGILAAIASHDGGRAAQLVADHIEGYYAEAGLGSGA
ncbi:MAG: hypothetical protein U1D68_08980 [Arthrobacter sp.]|nr:hypothetical protein [Arthrobacter sp.]